MNVIVTLRTSSGVQRFALVGHVYSDGLWLHVNKPGQYWMAPVREVETIELAEDDQA